MESEKEREGRERRMRMRRVKSMVDVNYKPRREMFRFTYFLPWVNCIKLIHICSRQLSLSSCSKESADRNGIEDDKQSRTDDLESVLNDTHQSNLAVRKYIKRRKSLFSSMKL